MLADREHFVQYLWASTLLASYFARARRLQESTVVIAAACQMANACGIFTVAGAEIETVYDPGELMLPPTTEAEASNVIWLAHSLFVVDQLLCAIAAFPPSLVREQYLIPSFEHSGITYPWFKMPTISEEELSSIWNSDVHLILSTTLVFLMVAALPRPAPGAHSSTTNASGSIASISHLQGRNMTEVPKLRNS
ncbi:hypothetical protein DL93DRAFT_2232343 [Clavulina sp. PMI_390]|nr:hypothetical protein DL93DRAFT_2232343 [Clavulina sp. PMI_390]